MSDMKLRDLERRWRETGAVDDEVAYLLERVRVTDLGRERLALAAYCGHVGAGTALTPGQRAPVFDLLRWAETGLEFGRMSSVVLLCFVCEALVARSPDLLDSRGGEVIEVVRTWIATRRPDVARRAELLSWELDGDSRRFPLRALAILPVIDESALPEWVNDAVMAAVERSTPAEVAALSAELASKLIEWALGPRLVAPRA